MTIEQAKAIEAAVWPLQKECAYTSGEIVEAFALLGRRVAWKYRLHAIVAISLASRLGSYEKAFAILRAHGVTKTDLGNAMHHIHVYQDFVEPPGPATSEWFDALNIEMAKLVLRASEKHGRSNVRKEDIFDGSAEAKQRIRELAS